MSHGEGEQLMSSIPLLPNTNHWEVGRNPRFEVIAGVPHKIHAEQSSNRE